MTDFVETRIISAVRGLLTGRVNELLDEMECPVPLIEFSSYKGGTAVCPVISFSTCEQSEKERIIRLDAYSMTITFSLIDTPESELYCYAYSGAVGRAFFDNPTLGGIVDRAIISSKKYNAPKNPHCGEGWGLTVFLRVTVEGINESTRL